MRTLARAQDKAEIVSRLRRIRPDSARRWGRMSSRMALGRKEVAPTGGLLHRTLVRWIALNAPVPWRTGILTNPEIDQECGGTKPADFSADVRELEALVELMTTKGVSLDGHVHPIFGRLSRGAWLRWAYLHMDHHLRQFGL
jgi:hypothetical protein